MLLDPKHDEHLAKLEEQLRCVTAVTVRTDVGRDSDCVRALSAHLDSATKVKVKWLIEAGAWTDATIALLGLELPQWKLRRLVNEDGKWLCSLSKQPWIPLEYDAVAEASHESLPLAILIALLQAQRSAAAGRERHRYSTAVSARSRQRRELRQLCLTSEQGGVRLIGSS